MIAIHGDDNGLIFPFNVAPIQIIIVPIPKKGNVDRVHTYCKEIEQKLSRNHYRVKIDFGEIRPGEKYYYWEMKGVPLRLEIGNKETKEKTVTIFRRDIREKVVIADKEILEKINELGAALTNQIQEIAKRKFDESISNATTLVEIEEKLEKKKILRIPWCSIELDGEECAVEIKERTAATVRGRHIQEIDEGVVPRGEKCVICEKPANCYVYVGKQY
jgi:prolyl-tRNA synthetase